MPCRRGWMRRRTLWYAGQGQMEQQTLRNTDILYASDVSMHRRHDLTLNPVSKAKSTISTPYPASPQSGTNCRYASASHPEPGFQNVAKEQNQKFNKPRL
ncbi:hypothetical protein VF21_02869 [Pseudogymnoascus sp. 05NY08]|nr:hypothetical protein VF21_02869 [Pseudogymnoascus sp. 05NY08]